MRMRLLLGLAVVLALGCASKRFAPVSGKVTLDGNPLPNATVSFQPIGLQVSGEAAPGSLGKTNEKGEYTLEAVDGKNGAWVGNHRVQISALNAEVGEADTRPPRGGWPMGDKVPAKYNTKSELTFEVPREGTRDANFDLHSK
jgi:hypothetical protein